MSDAPFDTINSGSSELEKPKADILEDSGSSSGRQAKKLSALRNFFKYGSSDNDGITPRSGGASARAKNGAHRTTASGEEDFDDHMLGSIYERTDICKACGFPRGSSVCCTVTRRHHGTDELMTPGRHHHSRSYSGGMNIMAKLRSKLPLSSGSRLGKNSSDDGEEHRAPHSGEVPLDTYAEPDAAVEEKADIVEGVPPIRNHTMSPQNLQFDGESNENAGADIGAYPSDSLPVEELQEEEVQYYCYTDENGETYYYTQGLQEPAHGTTQVECDGEEVVAVDADATAVELPEGMYFYQYIDENGETVNCVCTPQTGGDSPSADQREDEGEGVLDGTTPATSAVAHASSDTVDSSEAGDSSANRKKPTNSLFSAIQSVFKLRSSSRTHTQQHKDPSKTGAPSMPAQTSPGGAALGETTNDHSTTAQGCTEIHQYDADVAAFTELLSASEKKQFLKERKMLIKELTASEKKERESIMKNRQDGLAAFTRDKLAAAFVLRKDERTISSGQKRAEPL
ncbi:hypothetical protein ABL78_4040 [Leptomonas seymouri]|uniref:Uncharacterized protein n=1 Tax=Leptomonas seymouri TaxID=5684 RepID=A0A0N0P5V5_LEPSE|nr:hypothetical protein ABL78_4040 [Leptomonas seymouri]|eukprot:KPI86906.1 hypothetical protein ABL78_4040 [Leptomonas seymouri]